MWPKKEKDCIIFKIFLFYFKRYEISDLDIYYTGFRYGYGYEIISDYAIVSDCFNYGYYIFKGL